MPNVSRYVFVVPVFLSLTVFFFACTSAEPPKVVVPTPDISSAELFVMPADGGGFRARDLAEIEENLPFKVAFADPTYLPDGTKLTLLNVFLPPDQVQGEGRRKAIQAFLVYGNDDGKHGFQLEEGLRDNVISLPNQREFSGDIENGGRITITAVDDPNAKIFVATWRGCGINFLMTADPEGAWDPGSAVRFAATTVNYCLQSGD